MLSESPLLWRSVLLHFCFSFFDSLYPFLSEHFNRIVFVRSPYGKETFRRIVNEASPDLVIEERVERYIEDDPCWSKKAKD